MLKPCLVRSSAYLPPGLSRMLSLASIVSDGRHPGQPLTDGYLRAMEFLHGGCFYEDKCPRDVKGELREVNLLLEQAEKDASRCVVPRRKRRR